MKNNNLYLDIHVLQNVPPCCINRDDTGSPKTAKYGGTVRARVSSQSWKHEMRKMFKEIFADEDIGTRSAKLLRTVTEEIKLLNPLLTDDESAKLAKKAIDLAGLKFSNKDKNKTNVLVFFSKAQARAIAELIVEDRNDKNEYKTAFASAPSIDMALFGRMLADEKTYGLEASAQVAHAISTHTVHNEYDYFTAVDDLSQDDEEQGAGHLGTVEFNSSTLYRYATVNVLELNKSLGEKTADAVEGFCESFIRSMPTGKQNSFANRTVPDYVYVTLRNDQPINLCGAFEKPVSSKEGGYLSASEKALEDYYNKIYKKYECEPVMSWNLEEYSLPQIINQVKETVKDKLSESEGE